MTMHTDIKDNVPNGPVAAALLAGGIGSMVIGLMTVLTEMSATIKNALNWWNPAGPLAGKAGVGVIAFLVSWAVLHFLFRGKEVNFPVLSRIAFILLALGLIGTFPPFFKLFAGE